MLIIRQEQYDAFKRATREDFIQRMKIRLHRAFPDECEQLGDDGLWQLIDKGIGKAAKHGIEIEADVAKYLVLMVAFGPDFETDPKCPWAPEVLNDPAIDDPSLKATSLYDAALEQAQRDEGIDEDD